MSRQDGAVKFRIDRLCRIAGNHQKTTGPSAAKQIDGTTVANMGNCEVRDAVQGRFHIE
jgi:hypothetical protein